MISEWNFFQSRQPFYSIGKCQITSKRLSERFLNISSSNQSKSASLGFRRFSFELNNQLAQRMKINNEVYKQTHNSQS